MTNFPQPSSANNYLNKLKIISINVNSMVTNQKRFSLYNILKSQNPDIVFLAETKLKQNHVIRFKEYNIIREDRSNKYGGGTAIIIRKNIAYQKINTYDLRNNSILEHTIIKIKINPNSNLILIAAYATCGNQKEFIPDLNNLFNQLKLNCKKNYFILAGDLNAKHTNWLNPNNNPRGISLDRWLKENEFFTNQNYTTHNSPHTLWVGLF